MREKLSDHDLKFFDTICYCEGSVNFYMRWHLSDPYWRLIEIKLVGGFCSSNLLKFYIVLSWFLGCFPHLSHRHSFSNPHRRSGLGFHCTSFCTDFYPQWCLMVVEHLRRSIHMQLGPQHKRSFSPCTFWCTQLGCYPVWDSSGCLATHV